MNELAMVFDRMESIQEVVDAMNTNGMLLDLLLDSLESLYSVDPITLYMKQKN